jgi:hypothetical protein
MCSRRLKDLKAFRTQGIRDPHAEQDVVFYNDDFWPPLVVLDDDFWPQFEPAFPPNVADHLLSPAPTEFPAFK